MNKIIYILMMFILLKMAMAQPDNVTYAPTATGFTVTITANVSGITETAMNFTGIANTTVFPIGTNDGVYRWGYIYNTGTVSLSFQMASPTPANIILRVDGSSDMKNSFKVTNSPGHPSGKNWNGWRYVPPKGSANIFAMATFNSKAKKSFNIPVKITT